MGSHPIYVVEGPDGAGKTTLANKLAEPSHVLHCGNRFHSMMVEYHMTICLQALALSKTGPVVIDRWWPSEIVYSAVFRGGTKFPEIGRMLDRVATKHGFVYVMCIPDDKEQYINSFNELKSTRDEDFSDMSLTYDHYVDLCADFPSKMTVYYDRFDTETVNVDFIRKVGEDHTKTIIDHQVNTTWSGDPDPEVLVVGPSNIEFRRSTWIGVGKSDPNVNLSRIASTVEDAGKRVMVCHHNDMSDVINKPDVKTVIGEIENGPGEYALAMRFDDHEQAKDMVEEYVYEICEHCEQRVARTR